MVARDLKARYEVAITGARVDVRFGCDDVDARVQRVVVERRSGHGGDLEIWRLTRREPDAQVFDVPGIAKLGYFAPHQSGMWWAAREYLEACGGPAPGGGASQ